MRIYTSKQIKEWEHLHISYSNSELYDLMLKASQLVANWIDKKLVRDDLKICILCGKGNNGGDGYTVAKILVDRGLSPIVYDFAPAGGSRLREHSKALFNGTIHLVNTVADLKDIKDYHLCVDAIFGIGIDRPIEGKMLEMIEYINAHANHIMSIDIPSGMFTEERSFHTTIIAQETCTFTCPKRSFFSSTNAERLGLWVIRDLNLSPLYHKQVDCDQYLITKAMLKPLVKPRPKFSHKGTYGHCLLIGSSINMAGALVMAGKSAFRTGSGLVTLASSEANRSILQTQVPEAMFLNLGNSFVTVIEQTFNGYDLIAIGPGLGRNNGTKNAFKNFLTLQSTAMVLDADALNIISELDIAHCIPKESILTPHPKEFDRLFGPHKDDFERRQKQIEMSIQLGLYIVLKGAYTTVSTPGGEIYYNQTGNPGMAVGGSGDILTGMISSLVGQGYSKKNACILAVYLHGLAGDLAAKDLGEAYMISTDIINYISTAYKMVQS